MGFGIVAAGKAMPTAIVADLLGISATPLPHGPTPWPAAWPTMQTTVDRQVAME